MDYLQGDQLLGRLDGRYKYLDYANGVFTLDVYVCLCVNVIIKLTSRQYWRKPKHTDGSEQILCVNVNLMVTLTQMQSQM